MDTNIENINKEIYALFNLILLDEESEVINLEDIINIDSNISLEPSRCMYCINCVCCR